MNIRDRRTYIRFMECVERGERAGAFYHLGKLDAWGVCAPYASFSVIDTGPSEVLRMAILDQKRLLSQQEGQVCHAQ